MKSVKSLSICILCLIPLLISGCWDQKIFEEIGFALLLGLEQTENDELLYSVAIPVVSEDIGETIAILSTTSDLLRQSRDQIRNKAGKKIEGGKTQHIILSKQLAEKGIGNLLDVFLRSAENPLLANIIVVDGSPLEMFEISREYKDKPRIALYTTNVIKDARIRTATPDTRIYEFTILQYCETIDPIASVIGYNEKEIEVKGSALFNKDKMTGSIGFEETGLLHALMGEKIRFGYYIDSKNIQKETDMEFRGISVLLSRVKRKVEINVSKSVPQINISLDFTGAIDEIDLNYRLDDREDQKKLEEKISMLIEQDCIKLLEYLQKIESDPIGFGEIIRAKHNDYFKSVVWKSIYPKVKFHVDVKTNFEFHGALN